MNKSLNKDVVESLKKRYAHLHPLVFQRSLERARSDGELFDMLDSFPEKRPVAWDYEERRWVHTKDLLMSQDINEEGI